MTVPGAERPIELRALDIDADIAGSFAWTTVEMVFYNPNARILEGELAFPLENGQHVTGFALSMGEGKREVMRGAVPVEKQTGRRVFEEIVRGNVDPALLEVTQGNNFNLRVYPLPPGGTRRVRISYTEPLTDGGGKLIYRLPLKYEGQAGKFSLRIKGAGSASPEVSGGSAASLPIEITADELRGSFEITASAENAAFDGGGLAVAAASPGTDDVYFGERGGATYFYARIPDAAPSGSVNTPKAPSSLAILWDASASGRARDHSREFAFLAEFFRVNRDISVKLRRARDAAEEESVFDVAGGDWSPLKKALESTIYDGATNLGAFRADSPSDMYLLFSDGLDNYSANPLAAPKQPLFAVISAPGADAARLKNIAALSGGAVIDLSLSDPKAALEMITRPRSRISGITAEGARDVQWERDARGDGFVITGVMDAPSGAIHIALETPLKETSGIDIALDPDRGKDGEKIRFAGVPYLWASMRLDALDAEYSLNRGEIRRLGKSFGLATRETSLIVLDGAADYARYGIDPPEDLREEYDRLLSSGVTQNARDGVKPERVLLEWRQREEWWEKNFPKDTPSPVKEKETKRDFQSRSEEDGTVRFSTRASDLASDMMMEASAPADAFNRSGMPLAGQLSPAKQSAYSGAEDTVISIALRPWSPDSPYIRRMKEARAEDIYRIYLDERPDYENSPAFFLDVSYQLMERGQEGLSLRVLSNLAEMELGNHRILRVLGYRLLEAGRPEQAAVIFKQVLAMADYEPQSYRDLGLAYEAIGDRQSAIDALYEVVERDFGRNFPGIEVITLAEMNAIIAASPEKLNTGKIDPRFIANRPLDLRVVLTWDLDDTDIDLHVTDPNGEEAFYARPLSYQGGRVSPDNTAGYGPEEYSLKVAKPGKYRIDVNFYGHSGQVVSDATTIQLDFFTRYGTKEQKKQSVTMRLREAKDRIFVGEFEVK
jgi:tetratricopeptide (TPR) repeat protein